MLQDGFYDYLRGIDCSDVEVYAIPEGSVVFPKVPLMRVEGPVAVSVHVMIFIMFGKPLSCPAINTQLTVNNHISFHC